MLVQTRYFGEIDLDEEKIITFENGLMGFEEYKQYTILYDVEAEETPSISWPQSLEKKELALPVINPVYVKPEYNPTVEDELLKSLGEFTEDNLAILLIMNIPADITKITANLKAPLLINSDTKLGKQIIVEDKDYEVRYNIYEAVQKMKAGKGEV